MTVDYQEIKQWAPIAGLVALIILYEILSFNSNPRVRGVAQFLYNAIKDFLQASGPVLPITIPPPPPLSNQPIAVVTSVSQAENPTVIVPGQEKPAVVASQVEQPKPSSSSIGNV